MNPVESPTLDRMFGLYRATLCGSTLLMVGLSWPLWVDGSDFPKVPFLAGMPEGPTWMSWLILGGIVATLAAASLGWAWRTMLRINLPLLAFAILQDQDRFQPWAYQYILIGLMMACLSQARSLRLARWYVVGLYFYSGLSKLDVSFVRELGPTFLNASFESLGLSPTRWSDPARTLAILAMPAFEIAVAVLLLFPKTRRIGLVGLISQHASLIGILGPWNLGHSTIVLVWNAALIVENVILFGRTEIPASLEVDTKLGPIIRPIFWAAMIFPAGERLGLSDAWPAHALYASHAERGDIYLPEDDLDRFPESVRKRLGPSGFDPWRRLDLTAWSRDLRGTPPYPSGRVANAVAEFLAARYPGLQPIKLVQWSRASAWAGSRDRDENLGLRAIRKRSDRFFLNAHPAGLPSPKE